MLFRSLLRVARIASSSSMTKTIRSPALAKSSGDFGPPVTAYLLDATAISPTLRRTRLEHFEGKSAIRLQLSRGYGRGSLGGLVAPHGPTGPQSRSRNEAEIFLDAQPPQARPNDGRGPHARLAMVGIEIAIIAGSFVGFDRTRRAIDRDEAIQIQQSRTQSLYFRWHSRSPW